MFTMTEQTWNATQYALNGRFVADLAGGVIDLLDPRPGEQILDLGCGDGALTKKIAASGAKVKGVDSSESMVAAARAAGMDAKGMDADALDFDHEFDAVFSNAALHWMRNQDTVLAGVHRALKPGGRFVAEMGGHGNIAAIQVALRAVFSKHGIDAIEAEQNYFPTPAAYESRLRHHGFDVHYIELMPRPTPLPQGGMRGWLETFRRGLFERLRDAEREEAIQETVQLLKPVLCDDLGKWTADYVRLRFLAVSLS
ncbi:methyltransferase domain-containing protein [Alloacidobacterium dinghuense]|uniref:Methyltransferase domain-containing protein n=2 Tax=Alloacidobacterium dinghuense TaxID=2763107 RepID=A0A7G8BQT0_9BACT|nr:methyltransferase domain-containing protein [Alloacidobacterium dinghuense]